MFEGSCSAPRPRPVARRLRSRRDTLPPAEPNRAFFSALETAVAAGDGELLVRGAGRDGAVFVVDGRIAWVLASGGGERLGRALARHLGLGRPALLDALARCRRSGQSLVESLLDDGDVSLRALERALLEHHAEALTELAGAGRDELTFRPGRRAHGSALLFSASAVVAAIPLLGAGDVDVATPASAPAATPVPHVDAVLARMMAVEGALGAAVVDLRTGATLAASGGATSLDVEVAARGCVEVVRAELTALDAAGLEPGLEEILFTLGSQHHLVRLLDGAPFLALYLVTDRVVGGLGLARHHLRRLEVELAA